jgi:hypothetical protein
MKTHILGHDTIYLDLSVAEHLTLADAVRESVARASCDESGRIFGLSAGAAQDFAFSIRMLEGAARADGIEWLGPLRPYDGSVMPEQPAFSMSVGDDGSLWRITVAQLWFVEGCATSSARLYRDVSSGE